MEIDRARKLLKLGSSYTLKDVNSAFRRLAKRYHPDFNRGKETWAHRKMTELNLAYEKAVDFLTSPEADPEAEEAQATGTWQSSYRRFFLARFNRAINHVLQGIYTYYQYGLENVHLRREGIRRIRYKDSLKRLSEGIETLNQLRRYASTSAENENLDIFIDFSKAFLRNMLINKYYTPTGGRYESNAYHHYRNGAAHLDSSLKEVFFGDLLIRMKQGSYSSSLDISQKELVHVLSKYPQSGWVSETVLKLYLLELFTRVIALFKELRY